MLETYVFAGQTAPRSAHSAQPGRAYRNHTIARRMNEHSARPDGIRFLPGYKLTAIVLPRSWAAGIALLQKNTANPGKAFPVFAVKAPASEIILNGCLRF